MACDCTVFQALKKLAKISKFTKWQLLMLKMVLGEKSCQFWVILPCQYWNEMLAYQKDNRGCSSRVSIYSTCETSAPPRWWWCWGLYPTYVSDKWSQINQKKSWKCEFCGDQQFRKMRECFNTTSFLLSSWFFQSALGLALFELFIHLVFLARKTTSKEAIMLNK